MLSQELPRAAGYREKAAYLRYLAQDDNLKAERAVLIQVAQSYERIAATLEAVDLANRHIVSARLATG